MGSFFVPSEHINMFTEKRRKGAVAKDNVCSILCKTTTLLIHVARLRRFSRDPRCNMSNSSHPRLPDLHQSIASHTTLNHRSMKMNESSDFSWQQHRPFTLDFRLEMCSKMYRFVNELVFWYDLLMLRRDCRVPTTLHRLIR